MFVQSSCTCMWSITNFFACFSLGSRYFSMASLTLSDMQVVQREIYFSVEYFFCFIFSEIAYGTLLGIRSSITLTLLEVLMVAERNWENITVLSSRLSQNVFSDLCTIFFSCSRKLIFKNSSFERQSSAISDVMSS